MNNKYLKVIIVIILVSIISLPIMSASMPVEVNEVKTGDISNVKVIGGTIEPYKDIRISSTLGGIIDSLNIEIGQQVKTDQELIVLEQDQLKLQVQQAQSSLKAARANLQQLKNGATEEQLAASLAGVKQAEASLEMAQAGLAKVKKGAEEEQIKASEAGVKQAKAALHQAQSSYEMAKNGATPEEIAQVEASYQQAAASLEGAKSSLEIIQQIYEERTALKQQMLNAKIQVDTAKKQIEAAEARLEQSKIGLEQAQNNLESSRNNLEQARKEYDRVESLYKEKVVSQQQYDRAESQFENAKTAVKNAETAVENARKTINSAEIAKQQAEISYQGAVEMYNLAKYNYENPTQLKQQLASAKTQVAVSEASKELTAANLAKVKKGTRPEQIEISKAGVEQASAGLKAAEAQLAQVKKGAAAEDIQQSQAGVKQAEAALERARANHAQLEKGASEEEIMATESNVERAEIALEMARKNLEDSVIKSPISGIIASVSVDEGEMIGPGTPVTDVVDLSRVYINVGISADILNNIKVGDKVNVDVLAYDDGYQQGTIKSISPVVDPRAQTFPVKILMDNKELKYRGGMFADVYFELSKSSNALIIPLKAVLDLDNQPYVYLVKGDSVEKREIKLGVVNTEKAEVTDGLNKGDRIVVNGQNSLQDGDKVEVISQ